MEPNIQIIFLSNLTMASFELKIRSPSIFIEDQAQYLENITVKIKAGWKMVEHKLNKW